MATSPCYIKPGQTASNRSPCAKLRPPSNNEIELHEKWLAGKLSTIAVVRAGILPWRQAHQGQSAQDIVECPACSGKLHLSIAVTNGHVWAKCETEGCVSWIE